MPPGAGGCQPAGIPPMDLYTDIEQVLLGPQPLGD